MNTRDVVTTKTTAIAEDPPLFLAPEAVLEQLRLLQRQIPEFTQLEIPDAHALRSVANLDPGFVRTAIDTIGVSARVQSALGQNPEDVMQEALDADQWSSVERQLRSLLKGVTAANLLRRHRVGMTALKTYNISRQLVRGSDAEVDLIPRIADMKRLNKLGRRRSKAPQPPGTQGATPPAQDAAPSEPGSGSEPVVKLEPHS
jgi:hypothetical protein